MKKAKLYAVVVILIAIAVINPGFYPWAIDGIGRLANGLGRALTYAVKALPSK